MTLDLDRLAEIAAGASPREYTEVINGKTWHAKSNLGYSSTAFTKAFTPEVAAALIAELRAARHVIEALKVGNAIELGGMHAEWTGLSRALAAYDQAANAKETT